MLTRADIQTPFSLTKNLISQQNFLDLTSKVNTPAFSATLGLGLATATSWAALVHGGGWRDQRVTATMRYVAPTAQGSENFGVILCVRCIETGDAASTHYFYARCQTGNARITRVVGNVFTNLTSQAFVLPQDTDVVITFSAVRSGSSVALAAEFDAGGSPATATLSAADTSSELLLGGLPGFRTTSQTGYCSQFTAEQL